MKFLRKTALFLVLALLVSSMMFSCKDKDDEIDRDGWWLSDAGGRPSTPDDLPENIDFEGYEFLVFYRAGDWVNFYECEGNYDTDVNPVYQTVYERNLKVQSRLNAKITWVPSDNGGLSETASQITQILNSAEYYDFFLTTNNTCVSKGNNAQMIDFSLSQYINLSQPWWWKDVIEEISFDGTTINFLVGDMNIINITKMSAFYFNSDLIDERLRKTPSYFYDLVDEKKWTIEILDQLAKDCYKDLNGNQSEDENDSYAFPWTGGETVNQFLWSTRVADDLYTRSADGRFITLNFKGNDDIVTLCEQMTKLLHNNVGVLNYSSKPSGTFDGLIVQEFSEGKYVFLPQRLSAATTDYMRDMETDYGIIPYPLMSEGDEYISDIQDSSTCIFAPRVADRVNDKISTCIEALCAEAYRYTTEAFYNVALKNKYARDDDASRMIDLIYESAHKSFIVEYGGQASSIAGTLYSAVYGQSSVATAIAGKADAAQASINKFISDTLKTMYS